MSEYKVKIRGKYTADDGLAQSWPAPNGWDDCQTGKCPDCGGEWVWDEGGYVPGTRTCNGCGSVFNAAPATGGVAKLRRERFYR